MEGGIFLIISADGPILYCFVPYSCENYVAMTSSKIFDFMITFMKKKALHIYGRIEKPTFLKSVNKTNQWSGTRILWLLISEWRVSSLPTSGPFGCHVWSTVINNWLFSNLPFSIKSTTWLIFLPLQSKVPIRPLRPHVRPGWNLPKTEVLRNENQFALYHTILFNISSNSPDVGY